MKLFSYILFLFTATSLLAQNAESKEIYSSAKTLIIELESVDSLKIKIIDQQEKFKVISKDLDFSNTPKISVKDGIIYVRIISDANKIIGSEKSKYRAGQPLFPNYEIQIPENINVEVYYTKGNFLANNFNGNLNLYIANYGSVDINKFKGTINIEAFTGKINCTITDAKVNIETSKGIIESFLKDENLQQTEKTLKGIYKKPTNVLNIKTISGKVQLKPVISQK